MKKKLVKVLKDNIIIFYKKYDSLRKTSYPTESFNILKLD